MIKTKTKQDYRKDIHNALCDEVYPHSALRDICTLLRTVEKLVTNIVNSPEDTKYRRVRCRNETFARAVYKRPGGAALMKAIGFTIICENFEEVMVYSGDLAPLQEARSMILQHAERKENAMKADPSQRKSKAELRKEEREDILRLVENDRRERQYRENMATERQCLSAAREGESSSASKLPRDQ
mmetsp:Transcript_7244/g.22078  ORF Transcript_7244/g.22078 Transcript_7244/m.22078 type:complete len:185 (+) Transcript_7244:351-905(+)